MAPERVQHIFFFILLGLGLGLLFYLLYPFVGPIVLAAALSIVFRPLYRRIKRLLPSSEGLAAFISTIIVILLVTIPVSLLISNILNEVSQFYSGYVSPAHSIAPSSNLATFTGDVEAWRAQYLPWINVNFSSLRAQIVDWLADNLSTIFSGIFRLLFSTFIMTMVLYYLFKNGRQFKNWLATTSPLPNTGDNLIITKLEQTVTAIMRGSLLVAILQGVATTIGLAIFGVPQPILWGTVTVVAALVPFVGTSLIIAPAALYLVLVGQYWAAAGLAAWGVVFVSLIDNFASPHLMGRATKIHPLLILLSVLGGLETFGPMGFIMGPIILSLCLSLLEIYPTIIERRHV